MKSLNPVPGRRALLLATLLGSAGLPLLAHAQAAPSAQPVTLLNVSYDVAREFYKDYNKAFLAHWKQGGGAELTIKQSHGGSSKQIRAVIDGLEADVVTMNQALDIDMLALRSGMVPADWAKRLPDNAAPTTSVTVLLVRKGNPKGIKDWADVAKPGTTVVIPNPKLTGNGRYSYVAAYGAVLKAGGSPAQARERVQQIFANVPVFDGGGRAATTTFIQRNIGDALSTFESEVDLIREEFGDVFDVVYPSWTVLAENPVSVVDKVVDKRGTRKVAEAYLKYLWSPEAQEIAAQKGLRPRSAAVLAKHAKTFPKVNTFTVDEVFGGWLKAQKEHFDDGALYDQILAANRK
jgi:sulfate transport system substrate-binding protein